MPVTNQPVVIVGAYMVRYPLGGMLSYYLQWLVGLKRCGCEVIFVECASYHNACFDPNRGTIGDDPTTGLRTVTELLRPHDLGDSICFIDVNGRHYGMSEAQIASAFARADAFIDIGTHGSFLHLVPDGCARVLVDGEPGFRQITWENQAAEGKQHPSYDHYFTNGGCLNLPSYDGPRCGLAWRPVWNPVVLDLFPVVPVPSGGAFTTVMNWKAHHSVTWRGREYGQKDVEFARFMDLPKRTHAPCEIAVAGGVESDSVPHDALAAKGWQVVEALEMSITMDRYLDYIQGSLGEFSVCKHVFRATNSGWFSERSAAYLASGRPIVVEDTGFSALLPTGVGLHAVDDVEGAAAAMARILADPEGESAAAHALAAAHFAHDVVLPPFLAEIGIA